MRGRPNYKIYYGLTASEREAFKRLAMKGIIAFAASGTTIIVARFNVNITTLRKILKKNVYQ